MDSLYQCTQKDKRVKRLLDTQYDEYFSSTYRKDPKYFKKIKMSLTAVMKLMSETEKHFSADDENFNVKGKLIGLPSFHDDHEIIIYDILPLPEDDGEAVDFEVGSTYYQHKVKNLKYVGWYHSHNHTKGNNCFLSEVDVTTQSKYQCVNGTWRCWVGIVLDPTNSKVKPKLEAYCNYFIDQENNVHNLSPDGQEVNTTKEIEYCEYRWGPSWKSYYKLDIEYFSSELSIRALHSVSSYWPSYWKEIISDISGKI